MSLAYVYFEDEGGERRAEAAHRSTALPSLICSYQRAHQ
jgi:hypothetical protein